MKTNKIYEDYHGERKLQKRIISSSDFTYRPIIKMLDKYAVGKNKVLDIGCGVGTIDFYLANKGALVLGIDVSSKGIGAAKRNTKNLGLGRKINFKRLEFPNQTPSNKYDLIICSEVLEHLKEDRLAVKKIKGLLVQGGLVISSSPSMNSLFYRLGFLKKFDKEVGHLRRYNEKSYKSLFEKEGLEIMEIKKVQGPMRDFLFTNKIGGFLLRIINKWPFSEVFTFFDDLSVPIFGESDIVLVAQKK